MAKTYSTVPDKATGDVFTEAMWDTYIKGNVNNLIVPPACRVYHNTTQTLTTAVDAALSMNSEHYDTDSMHDNTTNNSRITIQTSGIYALVGHVVFAANATGIRAIWFRKGDSTRLAQQVSISNSASAATEMSIATIVSLSAGEYVELVAYQSSGGNLNVNNAVNYGSEFGATWLGLSA